MRLTAGALMFVLLLSASAAWGQGKKDAADREQARAHANAGRELFNRGQYADAIARFEQAEAIIHAPPHWLYIARAHDKQGQLLRARESYQKLVAEPIEPDTPDAFKRAVEQGKSELSALEGRIPRLTVLIAGPDGSVARATVDGGAVEVGAATEIDPGEHTVAAEADGWVSASQRVSVGESESRELTVTLAAIAAPPDPEDVEDDPGVPIVPIILLGSGAVGLGIGTVTGIMALGKADELKDICADLDPCPSEHEALKDDAESLATVSTVSLIVGGALVAGGGAWLLIELLGDGDGPHRGKERSAEGHLLPWLGPGVGGVAGRF